MDGYLGSLGWWAFQTEEGVSTSPDYPRIYNPLPPWLASVQVMARDGSIIQRVQNTRLGTVGIYGGPYLAPVVPIHGQICQMKAVRAVRARSRPTPPPPPNRRRGSPVCAVPRGTLAGPQQVDSPWGAHV